MFKLVRRLEQLRKLVFVRQKLRAYGGEIHIIPNGNITEVVNYSINNSLAVVDIRLGYETDIAKTEELIRRVSCKLI